MFPKMFNINRNVISSLKHVRIGEVLTHRDIVRSITHSPATQEEFKFIDSYNYVGNRGIYFSHVHSPYIIRVTDDYDQCIKGNQSKDDTCWWYFSKQALSIMSSDFNENEIIALKEELRNWKVIQSAPKHYFEWSIGLSRVYANLPNVPIEQKLFAVKQFCSTFYTDDSIEQLNSHPGFSAAADEYVNNLRKIWSGVLDQTTDLNQYRGQDNIPDTYIDNAIRALNIQTELSQLAKKLLKPKVYELYNMNARGFLDGCIREGSLLQKHIPNRTYIGETEDEGVRIFTVGVNWILPTNMTDESTAIHLNSLNPVNLLVSWITAVENDLIGHYKDKEIVFCPMSLYHRLVQSGKYELEAAKIIANRATEAKRRFEIIWKNAPTEHAKHYEYLGRYLYTLMDFNFVHGLRNCNCRYGWTPQLDW